MKLVPVKLSEDDVAWIDERAGAGQRSTWIRKLVERERQLAAAPKPKSDAPKPTVVADGVLRGPGVDLKTDMRDVLSALRPGQAMAVGTLGVRLGIGLVRAQKAVDALEASGKVSVPRAGMVLHGAS